MTNATGSLELASWDEDTYEDLPGEAKLTSASVTQKFDGDITGDGHARWVMAYQPDGTARFVGLQRVVGSIGDRTGSFVLETSGTFDGKKAAWDARVIPGSATDDLEGLTGSGTFDAPLGPTASFTLDYDFG